MLIAYPFGGVAQGSWGERSEPHTVVFNRDSRDIYICVSVVGQNTHAELRGQTRACSKVSLGRLKQTCDTRVIHYNYYARAALAWTKKKRSLRNEKLKANRA